MSLEMIYEEWVTIDGDFSLDSFNSRISVVFQLLVLFAGDHDCDSVGDEIKRKYPDVCNFITF